MYLANNVRGKGGDPRTKGVGVVTRSRKRRIGEISGGETQREGGLLEAEIYKLQFIYSLFQVTKDTVSTPSGRSRCSSFCCESVKEARCLQEPESISYRWDVLKIWPSLILMISLTGRLRASWVHVKPGDPKYLRQQFAGRVHSLPVPPHDHTNKLKSLGQWLNTRINEAPPRNDVQIYQVVVDKTKLTIYSL